MLRLWARRRRLLAASAVLTVIIVPLLLVMVNVNGPYVIGSDYDVYDYDAVDGVHAMVHQMSHNKARRDVIGIRFLRSKERIRTQTAHHTYNNADEDTDLAFPWTGSRRLRRGGSKKGIFQRKIQDSDDIPPEDVKGYAFLHQRALPVKVTAAAQQGRVTVVGDNKGSNNKNDNDEMYHASEDEDDYGVGDDEENPKVAMFEPQPDDDDKDEDYREEAEEPYDYWSRNREFKTGDFDPRYKFNLTKVKKPVLKYEEMPREIVAKQPRRPSIQVGGSPVVGSLVRNSHVMFASRAGQGIVKKHRAGVEVVGVVEPVVRNSVKYKQLSDSKLRYVPNCDHNMPGCANNVKRGHPAKPGRTIHSTMKNGVVVHRTVGTSEQNEALQQQQQQQQNQQLSNKYNGQQISPSRQAQHHKPHHITAKHITNTTVASTPAPDSLRQSQDAVGAGGAVVEYADHLPLQDQPATQLQVPQVAGHQGEVLSEAGFTVVTHGIYWSATVEAFVTPGITEEDVEAFRNKVSHVAVAEMREPRWNRCGRPRNQYIVLEDQSALCARYRAPHTKMIQGEILSFNLARLLGIDNVPVSVLVEVNSSAPQWRHVTLGLGKAGWEDGQIVVFIQWVHGLDQLWSKVKMPALILSAFQTGVPINGNHPALPTMSSSELGELLQWSDMILFDYVIGHYDRVASMQDGAERENKPSIMSESIRNLRKVPATNKLWFVDNESGLFDGYELMKYGRKNGPRFIKFHNQMLQTMCIFREGLIEGITRLASHSDPQEALIAFTQSRDPLYNKLPSVSKIKYFKQYFHSRLKEVVVWAEQCRTS